MSFIQLRAVHKKYRLGQSEIMALKNISIGFDKGEFTAVWGPSGSGKTTLLNLIGTIDEATSGRITINGEEVSGMSDNKRTDYRNKRIGFIFQQFNLIPVLTAVENVMLPLQIQHVTPSKARKKALEKLAAVRLEDFALHRPDKMSGGQRQRVAVARALVTEPKVVIADEPTANLDLETSIRIIEIMQDLNKKQNATFLFSTHDQRLLDRMHRRVKLEDGQLREN